MSDEFTRLMPSLSQIEMSFDVFYDVLMCEEVT